MRSFCNILLWLWLLRLFVCLFFILLKISTESCSHFLRVHIWRVFFITIAIVNIIVLVTCQTQTIHSARSTNCVENDLEFQIQLLVFFLNFFQRKKKRDREKEREKNQTKQKVHQNYQLPCGTMIKYTDATPRSAKTAPTSMANVESS